MNIERDSDPIVNSVPYSVARSIRLINRIDYVALHWKDLIGTINMQI